MHAQSMTEGTGADFTRHDRSRLVDDEVAAPFTHGCRSVDFGPGAGRSKDTGGENQGTSAERLRDPPGKMAEN
jgi:hypothetical protein